MVTTEKISIGDTVSGAFPMRFISYTKDYIAFEVLGDKSEVTLVPRFLSCLGQYLPKQCWKLPAHAAITYPENFQETGIYYIGKRRYQASLKTDLELDGELESMKGTILPGDVILGRVAFVYAIYTQHNNFPPYQEEDLEFFDCTTEALHDSYAYDVMIVIQDMGSSIEFPMRLNLIKKIC